MNRLNRAIFSGLCGLALAMPLWAADTPAKPETPARPERPARPEGGGDVLGRIKLALADIKLTQEQQKKADEILAKASEELAGGDRRAALQQVRKVVSELSAILDEDQKLLLENKVRAAMAGGAGNQPGAPGGARFQGMGERIKAGTASLELSDEQKKKVDELVAEMEKKVQELRAGGVGESFREKLMALRDEGQEKIKAILSEEQFRKFTEAMQQQGGLGGAGAGRPGAMLQNLQQAMSQLDLTEDQKTKLQAMRQDVQKKLEELRPQLQNGPTPELREKMRGIFEEMQTQMKEILTPQQQEKLRSLMQAVQRKPAAAPENQEEKRGL